MQNKTVAFIGVGAMGSGMARCLVDKGFQVRGYDVRPEALAIDGLHTTTSAADAATGADLALIVVLNADQAADAAFGDSGLATTLKPGTVVVCASTMSPARAKALAHEAESKGLRWLDAPISGGTVRAADGTLTSIVGGDPQALNDARSTIEAYSRDIFHLGPIGAGSTGKIVNQVLVYCNLASTVEAITLCQKLGADPQAVYNVICTSMGASTVFQMRVPKILDGSFESGGSLAIALKDLGIVEEIARENALPMPMSAQATQLIRATAATSGVDQDDLAVARLVRHLAGLG
jgi:L-threonate 2-dehydrogenase